MRGNVLHQPDLWQWLDVRMTVKNAAKSSSVGGRIRADSRGEKKQVKQLKSKISIRTLRLKHQSDFLPH